MHKSFILNTFRATGDSGEEELSFSWKRPQLAPDTRRAAICPNQFGGWGRWLSCLMCVRAGVCEMQFIFWGCVSCMWQSLNPCINSLELLYVQLWHVPKYILNLLGGYSPMGHKKYIFSRFFFFFSDLVNGLGN